KLAQPPPAYASHRNGHVFDGKSAIRIARFFFGSDVLAHLPSPFAPHLLGPLRVGDLLLSDDLAEPRTDARSEGDLWSGRGSCAHPPSFGYLRSCADGPPWGVGMTSPCSRSILLSAVDGRLAWNRGGCRPPERLLPLWVGRRDGRQDKLIVAQWGRKSCFSKMTSRSHAR